MLDPLSKRLSNIFRFLSCSLWLVLLSVSLNLLFLRWTTFPLKEGALAPRTIVAPRALTLVLPEPSPPEGGAVGAHILTLSPGETIIEKGELVSSALYQSLSAQHLVAPDFSPLFLLFIFLYFLILFPVIFTFFSLTLPQAWELTSRRLFLCSLYAFTPLSLLFLAGVRDKTGWDWMPLPIGIALLLVEHILGISSALLFLLSLPLLFPTAFLGQEVVSLPMLFAGVVSLSFLLASGQYKKSSFATVFTLTVFGSRILIGGSLHSPVQEGITLVFLFLGIYGIGSGLWRVLPGLLGLASRERLVELLRPDSPLLRELAEKAPGTYAHSEQMALLAEQAAMAIGADPLLARIGALYHDIGKMNHPKFFIENQSGEKNPHDDLPPTMSARIVMSHVKEGEELAHTHHLPPEVISFIRCHHGTSRASFFYQKAVEDAGESFNAPPSPGEFRYPGPLPKTREETLVMLADSFEATLHSLSSPSPEALRQTLWNIAYQKMRDHQLNESSLSLSDLSISIEKMLEFITGGAHKRLEYPPSELPHSDSGSQSSGA